MSKLKQQKIVVRRGGVERHTATVPAEDWVGISK